MKIKICGIKTLEEGQWAVEAGADLLGFNFYPPSPRAIEVKDCLNIVRILRNEAPNVLMVGVFVNQPPFRVREILDYCELDLAQLSGDESLADQQALAERAFKAIRFSPQEDESVIEKGVYVRKTPPALLVDAAVAGEYGGTGHPSEWEQAARLARLKPIVLAGGLTPQNVRVAIQKVKPWGVDVASGVESRRGVKDRAKIRAFLSNARQAFEELRVSE
jgi:phosphoribosylanthranilate isomerase